RSSSALRTVPLPDPLRPVMITSSVLASCRGGRGTRAEGEGMFRTGCLGFYQVEVPVAPSHQYRDALTLRIAVHQVVAIPVHFEQRLVECHGLAPPQSIHSKHPFLGDLDAGSVGFGLCRRKAGGGFRAAVLFAPLAP